MYPYLDACKFHIVIHILIDNIIPYQIANEFGFETQIMAGLKIYEMMGSYKEKVPIHTTHGLGLTPIKK